jgi:hypothetical protein
MKGKGKEAAPEPNKTWNTKARKNELETKLLDKFS